MLAPFGLAVLFSKPFHDCFTAESDSPLSNPHKWDLIRGNQLVDFPSGDSQNFRHLICCQYFWLAARKALLSHPVSHQIESIPGKVEKALLRHLTRKWISFTQDSLVLFPLLICAKRVARLPIFLANAVGYETGFCHFPCFPHLTLIYFSIHATSPTQGF